MIKRAYLSTTSIGLVALAITVAVILYPDEAFSASLKGLKLWFEVVLPALLPFFIISELLMGIGVINAIGVLLEPLMRPVFKLPGVAAYGVVMGLASGYPLGAKIAGDMRRKNLCTKEEGERLVTFANTADPLFMVGAVGVGMFGMVSLGATITLAHYLAILLVGFLCRFHAGGKMGELEPVKGNILKRAFRSMIVSKESDGRPFGTMLTDAVKSSFSSMLFIGGCIMLFAVIIRILTVTGIIDIISYLIALLLQPLGLESSLISPLLAGILEIDIGAQSAANASAEILQRVAVCSFIIGWSGISVFAQVAAMVHNTDIRLHLYMWGRFLHGILAAILTWFLFPVFSEGVVAGGTQTPVHTSYWGYILSISVWAGGILAAMILVSLFIYLLKRVHIAYFKV